jgi:hypothetical protein
MESVGKTLQDYFIKMAPDFSVLDLIEKFWFDKNESLVLADGTDLTNIMLVAKNTTNSYATNMYRAMFLVYSTGTLTVSGANVNNYVSFPYRDNSQILIASNNSPITINSTSLIEMVVGVAF